MKQKTFLKAKRPIKNRIKQLSIIISLLNYSQVTKKCNSETQKMMVKHFAGRLVQYMVTNMTKWDAHSLNQIIAALMNVMAPANGEKYAELHRLVKRSIHQDMGNCWKNRSLFAIWQKLAPLRELAQRKFKYK